MFLLLLLITDSIYSEYSNSLTTLEKAENTVVYNPPVISAYDPHPQPLSRRERGENPNQKNSKLFVLF